MNSLTIFYFNELFQAHILNLNKSEFPLSIFQIQPNFNRVLQKTD